MFWLSDNPLSLTVSLRWFREELPLPVGRDTATLRSAENWARLGEALSLGAENSAQTEESVMEGAQWRQIGKLHYLSYLEPSDLPSGTQTSGLTGNNDKTEPKRPVGNKHESKRDCQPENGSPMERSRTTLKLEPTRLTLIRHGGVRWNSVFARGLQHHSAMVLGGASLPVETRTAVLEIDVRPDGGDILLEYQVQIGNWPQNVRLRVQFVPNHQVQEV